ncbi:MAG: TIGR03617 family F420-dependent LLM class oxidoreductase [Pseudomonadota bacterium]
MKVMTSVPTDYLGEVGPAAKLAEAQGFTGIATQENRHDAFLPLAVAATQTSRLELRTSIAIAFARSPTVAASLSWDLQAASNGRFTLGLGSQVKGHNVRRFGVPWSAPAPRLREYVQAVRAIWDCWQNDTRLNYQGEHYQLSLMTPNFSPPKLACPLPRIQIAAVGPAMMKVAAEECDGVMLHVFCTQKYLKEVVIPRLERGLAGVGRARDEFEISGGGFIATGEDDESVEKMFNWVRTRIGFYGSTPSYWPVFEVHGLQDLGHKLNEMAKKGEWDAMTGEISDDVVRLFTAVGRFDEIKQRIEEHFGGLTDVISMPPDTPPDLLAELTGQGCPSQDS